MQVLKMENHVPSPPGVTRYFWLYRAFCMGPDLCGSGQYSSFVGKLCGGRCPDPWQERMGISSAPAHPCGAGGVSGHGWRGSTALCSAGCCSKVGGCPPTAASASRLLPPNRCFKPKFKTESLTNPHVILGVPHAARHPAFCLQSLSSARIFAGFKRCRG